MFTAEPQSVTVFTGETVQFNCTALGQITTPIWNINDIVYTWMQLPDKHYFNIATGSLTVTDVDLSMNNSTYQCYISNTGPSAIGVLYVVQRSG